MMADISETIDFDDSLDFSTTDGINDQSDLTAHNVTTDSFYGDFSLSNDTIRFLFIAIATITILICLTICISVFICICLNRRRNMKRQEWKDHRLLPEQSEKIPTQKLPFTNSIRKPINLNGKQQQQQQSDKRTSSILQHSSSNIITNNPPIKSYYYDNLDDIPFIDESRPTSFIDMTRV